MKTLEDIGIKLAVHETILGEILAFMIVKGLMTMEEFKTMRNKLEVQYGEKGGE